MEEIQIVFWRTPAPNLPTTGQIHFTKPVWMHSPEFIRDHGTGWRVVGYQIVGGTDAGDLVMSVMLAREVPTDDLEAPPSVEQA